MDTHLKAGIQDRLLMCGGEHTRREGCDDPNCVIKLCDGLWWHDLSLPRGVEVSAKHMGDSHGSEEELTKSESVVCLC